MRKFLTIAAAMMCLGALTPDAKAGGSPGFMSFNAMQTSYSFDGSEAHVGAMLHASIVGPSGTQLFFGATEPTNTVSMTVAGPVGILNNVACPITPINGVDRYECGIPTLLMAFDGPSIGTPVTITAHICDTQQICGPTATSTFRITPEPGILVISALGLLGLGLARRRATG